MYACKCMHCVIMVGYCFVVMVIDHQKNKNEKKDIAKDSSAGDWGSFIQWIETKVPIMIIIVGSVGCRGVMWYVHCLLLKLAETLRRCW